MFIEALQAPSIMSPNQENIIFKPFLQEDWSWYSIHILKILHKYVDI